MSPFHLVDACVGATIFAATSDQLRVLGLTLYLYLVGKLKQQEQAGTVVVQRVYERLRGLRGCHRASGQRSA